MPSSKKSKSKKGDFKFGKDEKVLVLPKQAGEDIYEAKVLDLKLDKQKEPQYKIHYKGWNKRWDEWVNQRRLLKINASNIQIMSEKNHTNKLAQQQRENNNNNNNKPQRNNGHHNSSSNDTESINSKSPSPNNSSSGPGRKRKLRTSSKGSSSSKRRKLNNNSTHSNNNNNKLDSDSSSDSDNNDDDDDDDDYDISQDRKRRKKRSPKIKTNKKNNTNSSSSTTTTTTSSSSPNHNPLEISLPTTLKRKLITDWENITKKHLLIEIPRKNGERISDILSDFESFSIEQGQDRNIVYEISRGIKDYFNQALQVTLLYKLERGQHSKIYEKNNHLTMDQIYGVEHLCRLFVKLPQLLSPTDLDNDTRKILKDQIECIIAFCLDNQQKYFCAQYYQLNS